MTLNGLSIVHRTFDPEGTHWRILHHRIEDQTESIPTNPRMKKQHGVERLPPGTGWEGGSKIH